MFSNEELVRKWNAILEHPDLPKIKDTHRRSVTAQLLENTELASRQTGGYNPRALLETTGAGSSLPVNATGSSIDNYDPVLISLVRRSMPNLIAYDVCGVQPMTGPTGLIFAMRSRYTNQSGTEAFYNEANTAFSAAGNVGNTTVNLPGERHVGTVPGTANNAESNTYNWQGGLATATAEALGSVTGNTAIPEMAFSIEKVSVTAKSRALKAEYTMELAQDLKSIHGLDAETELANIIQSEILVEINREVIRTINVVAKRGANTTASQGTFDLDVDANGRWSVEKFKGLMFQVEREANHIAKDTRRGKGNMLLCSSDVASALQMAGVLDYAPALNSNALNVDDTGNTFAGVLNGRIRVYIDPYVTGNYMTVGYKGASAFDAGIFYCPYVPLQMVRAVGEDNFQPKIGFKTRYGMVANPFAEGTDAGLGAMTKDSNVYYRRVIVANIL